MHEKLLELLVCKLDVFELTELYKMLPDVPTTGQSIQAMRDRVVKALMYAPGAIIDDYLAGEIH